MICKNWGALLISNQTVKGTMNKRTPFFHVTLLFLLIVALFFLHTASAQTVFITETFGTAAKGTSVNGYAGDFGTWTETLNGGQGANANFWFVSGEECGNTPPACGSGCSGGDASLHVGSPAVGFCFFPPGDCGAAYVVDPSGLTNKTATSPNISTIGRTGISMRLAYIHAGENLDDNCFFEYSTDGGTSWSGANNIPKGPCCDGLGASTTCGGPACGFFGCQGQWAYFTFSFPPSAEGIPNFRLRFTWVNDTDLSGVDPSFAVDDIEMRFAVTLPVSLPRFTAQAVGESVELDWAGWNQYPVEGYAIERSVDGETFSQVGEIEEAEGLQGTNPLSFIDPNVLPGDYFYRIRIADRNKYAHFSKVIQVHVEETKGMFVQQIEAQDHDLSVRLTGAASTEARFVLVDLPGRQIWKGAATMNSDGRFTLTGAGRIPTGVYLLKVNQQGKETVRKFYKTSEN